MIGVEARAPNASCCTVAPEDELLALETGALDPAQFPHREHVRLGYEMLERYPFGEALMRFSRGLRLLAARAGRPWRRRTAALAPADGTGRASGSPRSPARSARSPGPCGSFGPCPSRSRHRCRRRERPAGRSRAPPKCAARPRRGAPARLRRGRGSSSRGLRRRAPPGR